MSGDADKLPVRVELDASQMQATVYLKSRSNPIVAPVLGWDSDGNGNPKRIYLASRIHKAANDYSGWDMRGAISTILEKQEG